MLDESMEWSPRPALHRRLDGRPRVVVVGGGFGGLQAARSLAGADVDVVLGPQLRDELAHARLKPRR